jgi:5-methylcytosine-specific restriction enzyme subunit McrC
MKPIQVFEYDELTSFSPYFESEDQGKKVIDKLWQFNDNNKNIYFEARRNGVKFKQYVGVIQIGNITIEILPKADKNTSDQSQETKDKWHNVLLKMLAECKKIKVSSVSQAALKKRYHSLLDLYFKIFLDEVNGLINQGLIKKYRKQSGNVLALKGQLNFAKNIQQNLVHKERFYTHHQVYDTNHLINQILFKALKTLSVICNNSDLRDNLERTLARFPDIDEVKIGKTHFDRFVLSRKNTSYQEAIKIAKMILLNYSPDIKGGQENMIALLFDMNKLWEEYVYRMLHKANSKEWNIQPQRKLKFWQNKEIQPDIVLTKKGNIPEMTENYIIDTKWKIIDPTKPSDEDLKQMYAYNMYWDCERSMLLYPTNQEKVTSYGSFHKGRAKDKNLNQCKLGFVSVLDKEDNLNQNIGLEILELLK